MVTFQTVASVREHLAALRTRDLSIGLVPTMGALHEGHLSLIREAKNDNDLVVCSIFVNPKQFNNAEDLKNYPREISDDLQKLESENCDIVFNPSESEIYPEEKIETFDFGDLDKVMEGAFRPGHFNGMATVVKRLFEIIEPKSAYFGMKDYQQLLIVHKMTKMLDIPVEIVPCPIVRESSGLAMSSRNALLTETERKHATLLHETLKMVKIRSGFDTIAETKEFVKQQFQKSRYVKLEYFDIVDMYTLRSLRAWAGSNNVIACIAAWVGNVRLIDNMIIFS